MKARTLTLLLVLALATACSQASDVKPETFTLAGRNVQFAPPPTTWSRTVQEIPAPVGTETPAAGGSAAASGGNLVRFTPPWGDGHLTVTALPNWLDRELTEAHIRSLQTAVLKREDGRVLGQEEGHLGPASGYLMPFRYLEGGREMKGVQLHAIHDGAYWSVVLLVPADRFGQAEPVFQNLVSTWKFE